MKQNDIFHELSFLTKAVMQWENCPLPAVDDIDTCIRQEQRGIDTKQQHRSQQQHQQGRKRDNQGRAVEDSHNTMAISEEGKQMMNLFEGDLTEAQLVKFGADVKVSAAASIHTFTKL